MNISNHNGVWLARMFRSAKGEIMNNVKISLPGPEDITREVLPNGITILTRSNFNSPSVVVTGYFGAGALMDPDDKLGLAEYVSYSLMRGTKNRTFDNLYNELEAVGASLAGVEAGFGREVAAEAAGAIVRLDIDEQRVAALPPQSVLPAARQQEFAVFIHLQRDDIFDGRRDWLILQDVLVHIHTQELYGFNLFQKFLQFFIQSSEHILDGVNFLLLLPSFLLQRSERLLPLLQNGSVFLHFLKHFVVRLEGVRLGFRAGALSIADVLSLQGSQFLLQALLNRLTEIAIEDVLKILFQTWQIR
jgi:hypothetical protein